MPISRTIAQYLFEEKVSADTVAELLTKYKLLNLLPSVKQALVQMSTSVHREKGITIESPFPLSEESVQIIKNIVGDTKTSHQVIINKDVLAGFKAKYKGILYDGSASRVLRDFTQL